MVCSKQAHISEVEMTKQGRPLQGARDGRIYQTTDRPAYHTHKTAESQGEVRLFVILAARQPLVLVILILTANGRMAVSKAPNARVYLDR